MAQIDFVSIFKTQVAGQVQRATDLILKLENYSEIELRESDTLQSLMREFHTVKGAARAIQFDEIKTVAHLIEDVYHALIEGTAPLRLPHLADLSLFALDLIQELLNARVEKTTFTLHEKLPGLVSAYLENQDFTIPVKGDEEDDAAAEEVVEQAEVAEESTEKAETKDQAEEPATRKSETAAEPKSEPEPVKLQKAKAEAPKSEPKAAPKAEKSKKNSTAKTEPAKNNDNNKNNSDYEKFTDSLFTLSGELVVAVGSLDDQRVQMRRATNELGMLNREVNSVLARMVEELNDLGMDAPLEKITEIQTHIKKLALHHNLALEGLDSSENRLNFLNEMLSDQVSRARLVPLSTLFSSYPREVRDLSKELGKKCSLKLNGEHIRIDRAVLEAVKAPLLHIIRNSLDHGLEKPSVRKEKGKSQQGTLIIEAVQLGGLIRITITDDGAGIDMDKIKTKVMERGDTTEELWNAMSRMEQEQFLFLPGFSTSSKVTETSGRGFGMDIVKTEVEKIGGRADVDTTMEEGTRVILELPLSLSLTRCLLISGGKDHFFERQFLAIPLNDVGEVRRVTQDELRIVEGKKAVRCGEETMPLHDFTSILGLHPINDALEQRHLLVVGEGKHRHALLVDEVLDEQDVVTRPFDDRLGKLKNLHGTTLLRSGEVALIVDMKDLIQALDDDQNTVTNPIAWENKITEQEKTGEQAQVLVVEDSATVREVERHMLEGAGYSVTTAVNGVDGLNKLRGSKINLIISDIDMPRMNGIEMISKIRSNERHSNVPIIVVSYKDRDDDRSAAMDAGANYYFTKAAFDSGEMLEKIKEMLNITA